MPIQTQFQEHLASINACRQARVWAGTKTAQQTWDECERLNWLLWWASQTPVNSPQKLVRVAIESSKLVVHLAKDPLNRPQLAIDATQAWVDAPTDTNLTLARLAGQRCRDYAANAVTTAVYAAAYAADAAANAATAAAYAATAYTTTAADAAAAYAATAAAYAAIATAAANIKTQILTLIRSILTIPWKEPQ